MNELVKLLLDFDATVDRFCDLTENMSSVETAKIVVGWMGLEQAKKMNDWLADNPTK